MAALASMSHLQLENSFETLEDTRREIEGLTEQIERVAGVAGQIEAIAKQTNLLALNATIEAARAGEAGRGFSVVAGEVKALSGETSRATKEIGEILTTLNSYTDKLKKNSFTLSETFGAALASGEDVEQNARPVVTQRPNVVAPPAHASNTLPGVTEQQKWLVQESFARVESIAEAAAELFYGRLFEIAPDLRTLFKGDMVEQQRKLMATLKVAVAGLDNPDRLIPVVQALGVRHKGYGVADSHYDTVAEALLWTLGQGLGDHFTPEVADAWAAVYGLVSGVMIEAAAGEPEVAAAPTSSTLPGVTEQQKQLVQESFARVEPIAEAAAELFYGRLFEIAPDLRAMFKGDMAEQQRKLMAVLKVAVAGLDNPDRLIPVVQALGVRHKGYGVADSHYGTVAEALLWTLGQGLGDHFTPEVADAWAAVYGLLSAVMIKAAAAA